MLPYNTITTRHVCTLFVLTHSILFFSQISNIQIYNTIYLYTITTTVQKKESIHVYMCPQPRNTSTKKKYRVYTILQSMELNRLILL